MNKLERRVAYALFLIPVLWDPAASYAQSPFDGTWRTNYDQSKLSPKPYVFSLSKGMYDCSSCSPKVNVKADGTGQAVTGQSYDTISVREVDPKPVAVTTKKGGKVVSEATRTVPEDGKTLTTKIISHPQNSDKTVNMEQTFTRVNKAPAGANGASGSWRISKVALSDNGGVTTYKSNGGELSMSSPTGESYTAKLDGKDYPVKGAYFYNGVSLQRVDDRTIEETDKRDGKVVEFVKMSVAPDGKTITSIATDKLTGRVSTLVAAKQ